MSPEEKARIIVDAKLEQSGWIIQDLKQLNLFAGLGVAVREFPTSTGEATRAGFCFLSWSDRLCFPDLDRFEYMSQSKKGFDNFVPKPNLLLLNISI